MRSRNCRALASRSAFCPRAAAICELISVSCWLGNDVLLEPATNWLGAIFLDLGLGVRDLRAHLVDFAGEPVARGARLFLLRRLLHAQ